jgi:hypothetical protein
MGCSASVEPRASAAPAVPLRSALRLPSCGSRRGGQSDASSGAARVVSFSDQPQRAGAASHARAKRRARGRSPFVDPFAGLDAGPPPPAGARVLCAESVMSPPPSSRSSRRPSADDWTAAISESAISESTAAISEHEA